MLFFSFQSASESFSITFVFFFFFNDTATTEIYTLSLHDALPICTGAADVPAAAWRAWLLLPLVTLPPVRLSREAWVRRNTDPTQTTFRTELKDPPPRSSRPRLDDEAPVVLAVMLLSRGWSR